MLVQCRLWPVNRVHRPFRHIMAAICILLLHLNQQIRRTMLSHPLQIALDVDEPLDKSVVRRRASLPISLSALGIPCLSPLSNLSSRAHPLYLAPTPAPGFQGESPI